VLFAPRSCSRRWLGRRRGRRRPAPERLRGKPEYAALRAAFAAGCTHFGFRLIHYAVLNDHLHFLVEAGDRQSLTRGLRGLLIRVAKALNKLWSRHGLRSAAACG
jgi:REP element-mobilizing transposase RayT